MRESDDRTTACALPGLDHWTTLRIAEAEAMIGCNVLNRMAKLGQA